MNDGLNSDANIENHTQQVNIKQALNRSIGHQTTFQTTFSAFLFCFLVLCNARVHSEFTRVLPDSSTLQKSIAKKMN